LRPLRLVLAFVLLACAVLLALLASDLRAWERTMRADDLRFRVDPRARPSWTASTILPSSLTRGLLATDDDRALRRGVAAFRVASRTGRGIDNGITRQRVRAAASTKLAQVSTNSAYESQAADLVGVLGASGSGTQGLEASVASFQNAVRLDPTNESAQFNLELLLNELLAHGKRIGASAAPGPRGHGTQGAGAGTPGSGY
jgi:hypothetical protein